MTTSQDKKKQKLKALIKESVNAVIKEESVFGPPMTSKERAKDELQTVMLNAARKFLRNHFMEDLGPLDTQGQRQKLIFAYSELEDILVDAMMGWNLPASRGMDESVEAEAGSQVIKEASFQSHSQIEDWAGTSAEYLRQLSLKLPGKPGRELNTIAEKLEAAVAETWEHGYQYGKGDYENK